jgi:filamentous hemagglutinin family protein
MSFFVHRPQRSSTPSKDISFRTKVVLVALGSATIGISTGSVFSPTRVLADIVPDDTLGTERSQVIPSNAPGTFRDIIEGGAQRGGNLFHSFREFSVDEGRSAYFRNSSNSLQNILARVTGNLRSDILGELGILNDAGITSNPNLFLINPNGIIFGPNATLNVGGSFVATTASSVQLGDAGLFSASVPQTSTLLAINPSALQFNQLAAQPISISGARLIVPAGRSLLMVGGNVELNGGGLAALGGNIELGGLSGTGTVGLTVNGSTLNLTFPQDAPRGDVTLTNGAVVGVFGNNGSISISGRNINLLGGSTLAGGVSTGLGATGSQAGDIMFDATETVRVGQGTIVVNGVNGNTTGTGGDIAINAGSVFVAERALLSTGTAGQGNAGDITINARNQVVLDGVGSSVSAEVDRLGFGDAGNVSIQAESLSITNGATVRTTSAGRGDAGDVAINVRNVIAVDGASSINASGIVANVSNGAVGNAGNVTVRTGSLSITNGAVVGTSTAGQGNAGNVNIVARDRITLSGVTPDGTSGGIVAGVLQGANGNAGNVTVRTGSLSITNGAALGTATLGQGNAGNVNIVARDRIALSGVSPNGTAGGIAAGVLPGAIGDAGNVTIRTGSLAITNGASLTTGTDGQGSGGNVTVNARDTVFLSGLDDDEAAFGIISNVGFGAIGNAGNIRVTTGSLQAKDNAGLIANTSGLGNAGMVTLNARGRISFDSGSGLLTSIFPGGLGQAGDITVNTPGSIVFSNDSGAISSIFPGGDGQAGSVRINAGQITATGDSSLIASALGAGQAGSVILNTGSLVVRDNAVLGAASIQGDRAGSLIINARDNVSVETGQLTVAAVSGRRAGDLTINAGGNVSFSGRTQVLAASLGDGSAGTVSISAGDGVFIGGRSQITAALFGNGQAGSIRINADDAVTVDRSLVTVASIGQNDAGDVAIAAPSIQLLNNSTLNATSQRGGGGNIRLNTSGSVLLRNNSQITAQSLELGQDGNIDIDTDFLVSVPTENSDIIAFSPPGADSSASNIRINAQGVYGIEFQEVLTPESDITATGTVTISTPDVDPNRGLVELPTDVVDAASLVAQGCSAGSETAAEDLGEFVVTGRGGLPPNPNEILSEGDTLTPWVASSSTPNTRSDAAIAPQPIAIPVIEAQGWTIDDNGEIILTAEASTYTPHPAALTAVTCRGQALGG